METTPGGSPRDRGLAALRAGQIAEAVQFLTQAVAENPTDVQALAMLGAAHGQIGDMANAIAALEKAAGLSPQAGIHYNLGVAYRKAGQVEQAKAAMRAALAADASYEKARAALQAMGEAVDPAAAAAAAPAAALAPPASVPLGGGGPFGQTDEAPSPGPSGAPEAPQAAAPLPGTAPPQPGPAPARVPSMPASAGEAMAWTPPPKERTLGNRLLAGLGWGALTMGLWQGAWGLLSILLFGAAGAGANGASGALLGAGMGVAYALVMFVGGAVAGGVSGLIIAALGASEDAGRVVGAVGNVLFRLLFRSGSMVTGIVAGVLVGAWLGKVIASKIRGDVSA